MTKIAIIGAGRWGTGLAILLSRAGHEVSLVCPQEEWEGLRKSHRSRFLLGFEIPEEVKISCQLQSLLSAEIIFLAVPGEKLADAWQFWEPGIDLRRTIIVNTAKTINVRKDGHLELPFEMIKSSRGRPRFAHFAAAAFPQQVLMGSPTMGTVYAGDGKAAQAVQELFRTTLIRPYISPDLVGGQIGSALKNVIAIASGIAHGLGYDEMTQATIVSRGAREIRFFGEMHGASRATFAEGTTFWADLVGTCFSGHSRNFTAGIFLAKGKKLKDIHQIQHGTTEGLFTLGVLGRLRFDFVSVMPISFSVWRILENQTSPKDAVSELLSRPLKGENE